MSKPFSDIRVGVIGVGSMGQNHARVYSEISDLVGVADPDEKRGKLVAQKFGVEWFSDYKELLNMVDSVSIAVPTVYHLGIGLDAISKNVNLLVEKPICDNIKDAKKLVSAAQESDVVLSVGHIERYNPAIAYCKQAIVSGVWGELLSISSKRFSDFPQRIRDVGVVFDIGIHDIDISNYISNSKAKTINSIGGSIRKDIDDNVSIIIKYENGINSLIEASWLTPTKVRELCLICKEAFVRVDYMGQTVSVKKLNKINLDEDNLWESKYDFEFTTPSIDKKEPLFLELSDFLNAVKTGSKPLVSGAEAIYNVEIAEIVTSQLNNQ